MVSDVGQDFSSIEFPNPVTGDRSLLSRRHSDLKWNPSARSREIRFPCALAVVAGSRSSFTVKGGRPVRRVFHQDPDRRTSFLASAKFPLHNTTGPPRPGSIQFPGLAPVS